MKIKITEGQLERIKHQIKEGVSDKYNREVNLNFNGYRANYKGYEINDILSYKVRLSYDIEIEGRSWGIKDISLSNISGPSEVEVEIEYYIDDDNTETVTVPMQINWEMVVKEEEKGMGGVSVGDDVDIELVNDTEGNLVIKEIRVTVYMP